MSIKIESARDLDLFCAGYDWGWAKRKDSTSEELEEYRMLFDLQWKATRRADALWKKANECDSKLFSPGLHTILEWLMERADKAEAALDMVERVKDQEGK